LQQKKEEKRKKWKKKTEKRFFLFEGTKAAYSSFAFEISFFYHYWGLEVNYGVCFVLFPFFFFLFLFFWLLVGEDMKGGLFYFDCSERVHLSGCTGGITDRIRCLKQTAENVLDLL
jgi:hypothetical protein